MIVEIKGRELTATYHRGSLHISKTFRFMLGLKDNDILVIKLVEHSHSTKMRNPPNRNMDKKRERNSSTQEHLKENKKGTPHPYVDYTKLFKLLDEEYETPWDNE
jgi:hypothetical protein